MTKEQKPKYAGVIIPGFIDEVVLEDKGLIIRFDSKGPCFRFSKIKHGVAINKGKHPIKEDKIADVYSIILRENDFPILKKLKTSPNIKSIDKVFWKLGFVKSFSYAEGGNWVHYSKWHQFKNIAHKLQEENNYHDIKVVEVNNRHFKFAFYKTNEKSTWIPFLYCFKTPIDPRDIQESFKTIYKKGN